MNDYMLSGLMVILSIALSIAGMVFLYLKILPKKYDGTFGNDFLQMIHDYFNFKKLYIESVLKFLFSLATISCIASGIAVIVSMFLGLFRSIGDFLIGRIWSLEYILPSFFGGIFIGIIMIVAGPVIIRLIYEGIMMFILLVKNVIEINNKTKDPENKA